MKKSTVQPKIIIPLFAVIAAGLTFYLYSRVGNPPVVSVPQAEQSAAPAASSGTVSLSWPKSGRVESVSVKAGDSVKAGQVLASLSAPDAAGAVAQAKGALDLAQAQYASLNTQYATTKKQQDLLVANAYNKLLSEGLEGTPSRQDPDVPVITGTYTCDTEGSYVIKPYPSSAVDSGYSFNYSGLESGNAPVTFDNAVPLGHCGLQIEFTDTEPFSSNTIWTIDIPNLKSSVYLSNKNAYDLAVNTREKTLADLSAQIGKGDGTLSVAEAQIEAAQGAYDAAEGAYQNNLIAAPFDGIVTFVDPDLKIGAAASANKSVMTLTSK